jgi:hypothetical protein
MVLQNFINKSNSHWDLSNGVILAIDVLNHRINDGETIFTNAQVGLECNM